MESLLAYIHEQRGVIAANWLIFLAFGAVIAIVAWKISSFSYERIIAHKDATIEQIRAALDAKDGNSTLTEIDNLKAEVLVARKALSDSAPRSIPEEITEKFTSILRNNPGRVELIIHNFASDGEIFAGDLQKYLEDAKWAVKRDHGIGLDSVYDYFEFSKCGLALVFGSDSAMTGAQRALKDAMDCLGLAYEVRTGSHGVDAGAFDALLIIFPYVPQPKNPDPDSRSRAACRAGDRPASRETPGGT
ncbi:MAG: hypothetical protein ACFE0P_07995 [Oceanicaulis sp.]